MKASGITHGASYEDARGTTVRTVMGVVAGRGGERTVVYFEESANERRPLYWPLREMKEMPLGQFAAWAIGPAKKRLTDGKPPGFAVQTACA